MIERHIITSREEWLKWRRQDVTASDIGALFGHSSFKSPLQLWAEKTGRVAEPWDTPAMRRGRWLEPAVLTALAETYPRSRVLKCNEYFRDPDVRIGATPDAFLDDTLTLIEAKVVAKPVFDAWPDCPLSYKLQALTGAMLMNAPRAIVAVLVLDTYSATLELFHVERSDAGETKIIEGVKEFWQSIERGEPPAPDYGQDGELLTRIYQPKETIEPIDLSTDNRLPEILVEHENLKGELKAREERIGTIRAEVVDKLRGAPVGLCGPWRISNKLVSMPERIVKASTYPRLTITRRREES